MSNNVYRIRHFPTYGDNKELREFMKFMNKNNMMNQATDIYNKLFNGFNGWPFNEWLIEYIKIGSENIFEFYITIIYEIKQEKYNLVAIGMYKVEENNEIKNKIIKDNNIYFDNIIGFKLANIAVIERGKGIGSELIKSIEESIVNKIVKPTNKDISEKKINKNQIDGVYIWGVGGKGVLWENLGFSDYKKYLSELRKFYKKLGHITEITTNKPFLHYKYIKIEIPTSLNNNKNKTEIQDSKKQPPKKRQKITSYMEEYIYSKYRYKLL
jgi:hypothetical protein